MRIACPKCGLHDNKKVYKEHTCSSCGARLISNSATAIIDCIYCGSREFFSTNLKEDFRPDGIIPFQIDKEKCLSIYQEYLMRYNLIAKSKKNKLKVIDIKGIYVPFYLYSYDTMICSRGIYKSIKNIEESYNTLLETKQGIKFNIPQNASSKLKDEILNGLDDFNLDEVKDFNPAYLSGFFAELEHKEERTIEDKADERCAKIAKRIVERNFSAKFEKGIFDCDLKIENRKYILLPVWFITLECDNERYTFAVNGQSGKFLNLFIPEDRKFLIKSALKIFTIGNLANVILSFLLSLCFVESNDMSANVAFFVTFIILEFVIIGGCIEKIFLESKPPKAFQRDSLINCQLINRTLYNEKVFNNIEQYIEVYGEEEIKKKVISIYKDSHFIKIL